MTSTTEKKVEVRDEKETRSVPKLLDEEEDEDFYNDDEDYCDGYDDFALGGSAGARGSKGSSKSKGAGKGGVYSTKHTRLRESRQLNKR